MVRVYGKVKTKAPKNEASHCAMPLIPFMKNFLVELQEYQNTASLFYGNKYVQTDYVFKKPDGTSYDLHYLGHP